MQRFAVISCLGSRKGDQRFVEHRIPANKNLLNFVKQLIAINLSYCQQYAFRNQGCVSRR